MTASNKTRHYQALVVVAALSASFTLRPIISSAQSSFDISVAGGADTRRIVAVSRQGQGPIVLSLQGSLSWTSPQDSSSGFVKYRWGVLDSNGSFLAAASEAPSGTQLRSAESGFTALTVDRSILFTPPQPNAASDEDLLIAI